MYNFHTHTCMALELLANEYFFEKKINLNISADFLETGGFFLTIAFLLQHKKPNDPEVLQYLQANHSLLGLCGGQIPDDDAQTVYKQFEQLFESD